MKDSSHLQLCAVPLSFTVGLQQRHTAVLAVLEWAAADRSDSPQQSADVEKVFYNHVTIPDPVVIPLRNFCYRNTRLNNLWKKPFRLQFPNILVVFTGMW